MLYILWSNNVLEMHVKNGSKDLKRYPQISRRVRDPLARLLNAVKWPFLFLLWPKRKNKNEYEHGEAGVWLGREGATGEISGWEQWSAAARSPECHRWWCYGCSYTTGSLWSFLKQRPEHLFLKNQPQILHTFTSKFLKIYCQKCLILGFAPSPSISS